MSESHPTQRFESIAAWREDFLRAAAASSRRGSRWRRPLVIGGVALALAGSGGIAAAALSDSEDLVPLEPGVTVGYIDLATGEPITCPDGGALTYSAQLPSSDVFATCPDGSVPEVFREQREALEAWLLSHPPPASVADAPTFSYAIPEEER